MEQNTIIASFVYMIFFAESTGFSVCTFKEKKGKKVKCVGNNLPTFKNVEYELTGTYEADKNGNEQFKVESYTEHVEKEKDSIIGFLSSGAIRGIGKKTAERIFDMYGVESLEVIEKRPEDLLRVRGISMNKLDAIIESYAENHLPKDIIELLLPCGFTTKQVIKVYKIYKTNYMERIKENPYEMCSIRGITFSLCDRVGRNQKISERDPRRLQCAITEALKENFFSGKVGATTQNIISRVSSLTGLTDKKVIHDELIHMVKIGDVTYKKLELEDRVVTYFYRNNIKEAEEKLANLIISNMGRKNDKSMEAENLLSKAKKIRYDLSQKSAIINAFRYNLTIITGGPGTGKTTTGNEIVNLCRAIHKKTPILLAPTGKAARRMTESTGVQAYTFHSKLNLRPTDEDESVYNETEKVILRDEIILCDEFSMVDMMLAIALFEHTENCSFIIMGDPNQLQSVGAGNVLLDMINCGKIPTTELIYEHRQGEGSTIKKNANGMQKGQEKFVSAEDFICEYHKGTTSSETLSLIEDRMIDEYLRYYNSPSLDTVVCLCPYKNNIAGMYSVNKRLQNAINPGGDNVPEFKGLHDMVFRVGDPVMHVEKNTEEVCNGNTGVVKAIKKLDGEMTVIVSYDLGDKTTDMEYTMQNISQLALAYAMTIHKSQGSEYDAVVTCLTKYHSMMKVRRIPYTAITRAKKSVSIFFDEVETLKDAIRNNSTEDRNTLLCYYLKIADEKKFMPRNKETKKGEVEGQLSLAFA